MKAEAVADRMTPRQRIHGSMRRTQLLRLDEGSGAEATMKNPVLIVDTDPFARLGLKNELSGVFEVRLACSYDEARVVLRRRAAWAAVVAEARLGTSGTGIDLLR